MTRFVFAITAAFPLITAGVAGLIDEKPVGQAAAASGDAVEEEPVDDFVEHLKEQGALL